MRYIALDIETTGLDPVRDQILEIGAVIEDTEADSLPPVAALPCFHAVLHHPRLEGSEVALGMNLGWYRQVSRDMRYNPTQAAGNLADWVRKYFPGERPQVAGANVGAFDLAFLRNLFSKPSRIPIPADWVDRHLHYRTIEVGSVGCDWTRGGSQGLGALVKERLGHAGGVPHRALDDARLTIEVLRTTYPIRVPAVAGPANTSYTNAPTKYFSLTHLRPTTPAK